MTDKLEQAWINNYGENDRKEQTYLRYVEWLESKELTPATLEAYKQVGAVHLRSFYPDHGAGIIPEVPGLRDAEELATKPDTERTGNRMHSPAQECWEQCYWITGRLASYVHVFVDEECFTLQGWK